MNDLAQEGGTIIDISQRLAMIKMQSQLDGIQVDVEALKGGGGGGTSGGMEARVAVLETHMETVRRDVGELRTDMRDVRDRLTTIESDVKHLPGKGYVVTVALAIMAFVTAVAAFQQQIQHFVHG